MMAAVFAFTLTNTSCSKDDDGDDDGGDVSLKSETYAYAFNNGQLLPDLAYDGTHNDELSAELKVDEMANGKTKITVSIMNTVDGAMYMIHAHDAADPATTPNGTPYNETPNANILVQMAEGNGGTISVSQTTDMSYAQITSSYEGFFVIHDPLQPINTADPSTYLVVGSFARAQASTNFSSQEFSYNFNTGQLAPAFAYSGSHPTDLMAMLKVQELGNGESRVSVTLNNTQMGETYMVHSHDAADPATTPNGTPYNETPNANVLAQMAMGNGGSVRVSQHSSMSYSELTTNYEAFFVVHDPLQAINTADPTTYVILGSFAR